VDLNRDILYRNFLLNDEDFEDNRIVGNGLGKGLVGCIVESAQMSDVDVVQFMEKRSQGDGMDVGTPFLGVRRIRMSGSLFNVSRALLYDDLAELRAALNPVLATRESPLDYGYLPLYFSWPTNRIDDYPAGAIDLMVKAMPRAFDAMFGRDNQGGDDEDPLAIPWSATFICRDPGIYASTPQDIAHAGNAIITGATASAATNLVTKATHGLVAGDRVRFTTLTAGAGLNLTTTYYVIAGGLTASTFAVSTTSGGAAVDITVNYTTVQYIKSFTTSGTASNRGNYLSSVNGLWVVGASSGTINGTIGDSTFVVTIPASTGARTIRFKGADKVLTLEENSSEVPRMDLITFSNDTTWPLIDPGDSAYSITFHGLGVSSSSHTWYYEQYA
jgi:hypothetical protein